jgi:methylglyoxal synthase
MKVQMSRFVESHLEIFKHCRIITTGSTGKTLEDKLGLKVYHKVASGPLGGDQEIGALVTQGKHTLFRPFCVL